MVAMSTLTVRSSLVHPRPERTQLPPPPPLVHDAARSALDTRLVPAVELPNHSRMAAQHRNMTRRAGDVDADKRPHQGTAPTREARSGVMGGAFSWAGNDESTNVDVVESHGEGQDAQQDEKVWVGVRGNALHTSQDRHVGHHNSARAVRDTNGHAASVHGTTTTTTTRCVSTVRARAAPQGGEHARSVWRDTEHRGSASYAPVARGGKVGESPSHACEASIWIDGRAGTNRTEDIEEPVSSLAPPHHRRPRARARSSAAAPTADAFLAPSCQEDVGCVAGTPSRTRPATAPATHTATGGVVAGTGEMEMETETETGDAAATRSAVLSEHWLAGWLAPPLLRRDTACAAYRCSGSPRGRQRCHHVTTRLNRLGQDDDGSDATRRIPCAAFAHHKEKEDDPRRGWSLVAECTAWCHALIHQRPLQHRLAAARADEAALRQRARRIDDLMHEMHAIERDLYAVRAYYARAFPDFDVAAATRGGGAQQQQQQRTGSIVRRDGQRGEAGAMSCIAAESPSGRCGTSPRSHEGCGWPPLPPLRYLLPSRQSCLEDTDTSRVSCRRGNRPGCPSSRRQSSTRPVGRSGNEKDGTNDTVVVPKGNGEEEEAAAAAMKEAWRAERAELAEVGRRLRMQRSELEFHIRRGTHIKDMDTLLPATAQQVRFGRASGILASAKESSRHHPSRDDMACVGSMRSRAAAADIIRHRCRSVMDSEEYTLARLRVEYRAVLCALRRSREGLAWVWQRAQTQRGGRAQSTERRSAAAVTTAASKLRVRREELADTVLVAEELMTRAAGGTACEDAAQALLARMASARKLLASTHV